jgi:hypothetical protein
VSFSIGHPSWPWVLSFQGFSGGSEPADHDRSLQNG